MAKEPEIVIMGILDTKGEEIEFLRDQVKKAGGKPTVLEISPGADTDWADIRMAKVAEAAGKTKDEVLKLERAAAGDVIAEGGSKIIKELYEAGKCDGMLGFGGSLGTSIASRIMRALPIGVPKIVLSTMASGDCAPYIGTKDLYMGYPIAEKGLNKVTRKVLSNACGAIVGAAQAPEVPVELEKPLIGLMMFGVTTPCVTKVQEVMAERGYDTEIHHAVGSGGRSMEELIRDGLMTGIADITTHELVDQIFGGVLPAGEDRLTAAGDMGIPQVISTGGLDMINFGTVESVPKKYHEQMKDQEKYPGRNIHSHHPMVILVSTIPDEAYEVGKDMATKVNRAKGPAAIVIPMHGWGAYDQPGKGIGWAEDRPAPCWTGNKRNTAFVKAIEEFIDGTKDNVDVLKIDKHMNDPEFGELMANMLDDMIKGKWKKGMYRDLPYVQDYVPQ